MEHNAIEMERGNGRDSRERTRSSEDTVPAVTRDSVVVCHAYLNVVSGSPIMFTSSLVLNQSPRATTRSNKARLQIVKPFSLHPHPLLFLLRPF